MMDLEPCYNFENSTECVSLTQNLPCSFVLREKEFHSQAAIVFDTDGSIDIVTEIPSDSEDPLFFWGSKCETNSIVLNGQKIPVFISSLGPSPSGNVSIKFSPNQEPFPITGVDETPLSKVIFYLFDFKDRIGTSRKIIRSDTTSYALGVTELESRKWKVELHEIKKSDETDNKKNRNPVLTHVCCLTRVDGSEFDGKSANQIMFDLGDFFTFSQGSFCRPVMPVGFDKNGNSVWAVGASPHHPVRSAMSWFDPHHSCQLAKLFPKFILKLENERWKETLHAAIYWYVRSNNTSGAGIDSGIILSQVAIERLAYEYAVNHRKLIESKGFKDLKASDKFRLLFASLDIPTAIPPNLSQIQNIAKKFNYIDSPHFMTEIRVVSLYCCKIRTTCIQRDHLTLHR